MIAARVECVCGSVVDRTCGPRGLLVCVAADGAKDPAGTNQGWHVEEVAGVVYEGFPSNSILGVKEARDIDATML